MSQPPSSTSLEAEVVLALRTIAVSEREDAPGELRNFTRLLLASIVISDDARPPARTLVAGKDDARLVRWSNVRFNWPKIAAAAVEVTLAVQTAHSDAFWFAKALQVFLQLKDVRNLALTQRMGLTYWAMWANRDVVTRTVGTQEALASAREVFAGSNLPLPDEAEFTQHLYGLANHGCLVVDGDTIRLSETAELRLR